ncbi:VOC family protein [Candidatus Kapabacteria bacterium]|nr:VOC family protein [Candidatus Kapabacteria bacterium]
MAKITGIGGIFFKAAQPEKLKEWYKDNLGIDVGEFGANFHWGEDDSKSGSTVWNIFDKNSNYTEPSENNFVINYRVDNLDEFLSELKMRRVMQYGDVQEYETGKFAWVLDPYGNKIELWEPSEGQ